MFIRPVLLCILSWGQYPLFVHRKFTEIEIRNIIPTPILKEKIEWKFY